MLDTYSLRYSAHREFPDCYRRMAEPIHRHRFSPVAEKTAQLKNASYFSFSCRCSFVTTTVFVHRYVCFYYVCVHYVGSLISNLINAFRRMIVVAAISGYLNFVRLLLLISYNIVNKPLARARDFSPSHVSTDLAIIILCFSCNVVRGTSHS